ncbi:MAG: hypothetical protein AAGH83_03335 [Pseudomonadota bacterium]
MRIYLASAMIAGGTVAWADEHNIPADLHITCNDNGAVVVLGQNTVEPGATYYLGKDCDAYRPGQRSGQWRYAASAFVIEINGTSTRFANELNCSALPYC